MRTECSPGYGDDRGPVRPVLVDEAMAHKPLSRHVNCVRDLRNIDTFKYRKCQESNRRKPD
jgi:hypothetical protein